MQISAILFLALMMIVGVVRADVDYFKQPSMDDQVFAPGSSVQFVVSQLPDIDGQAINANVYAEGRQEFIGTIRTWPPGSVSDSEKNDFTFSWGIPAEGIDAGRYFVKIDINNDQDDNDICRSKSFWISSNVYGAGAGARQGNSGFVGSGRPAGYVNSGMKTSTGLEMNYNGDGQRYNGGRGGNSGFVGSGRPAGYVSSGMKTSTGPKMNYNGDGQRYSGGRGGNSGSGFSALHLRRARN